MKKSFLLLIVCCDVTLFSLAQVVQRIDGTQLSSRQLDGRIRKLLVDSKVSGAAVAVFNRNQPVFNHTYGFADVASRRQWLPNSEVYAASLAKMVFAYIVMQFVDEKLINLDTPLHRYLSKPLPDYKIPGWNRGYQDIAGDERWKSITPRMCLTHTTGFPNWRWFESDKKLKFKFDPGVRYSYSGEGLYLLQFVIEQITGKDYETISRQRVFQPFDMQNTSQVWQSKFDENICYGHDTSGKAYELMKWKEASAGGSMTTTSDDFAKFYKQLISGKGLSESSFKEMTSTQIRIQSKAQFGPLAIVDDNDNDNIKLGYGLGVGVFQTPFGRAFFKEGHDDGWGHYSVCFPEKQTAIFIMTNNDNGEGIFRELLKYAIGDQFTPWKWENYIPYKQVDVNR